MSLRIGTLADNPILKKKRKNTMGNRKEREKDREEKERKKRSISVDRSSQAGNFSISLTDVMQYLFQEGTKALSFSHVPSSAF